ncbi:hypothetical protein G7068_04525 [Leucobacter viscericola]|uniref:Putative T7SS secretion signal domain-containing protein n=2 Tax=Leucobacter viscericola TaxID=2714935 RepID=A0A6G7XD83_9MICO|nr:hypothetical protein [Leucobacter viscericola]QIK62554.1 hypothetical protein G7068_04525 [Leucobacter viscericola]
MVASALADYQTAFNTARAEAQAAIMDAQAAERLTSDAQTSYRDAIRKAATAKPGTPDAKVAPYTDPGAVPLQNAQTRLDTARTTLNNAGNTTAATIQQAALKTSNVKPTITGAGHVKPTIRPAAASKSSAPAIEWWDQILEFPGRLVEGFLLQGTETAIGMWQMLPFTYMIDELFGGESWMDRYGEFWGNIGKAIAADPWSIPREIVLDFFAADHWNGYAGEGVGRVFFNVASIVVAPAKLAKLGKVGKVASKVENVFKSVDDLALNFFGKNNAGKPIKIGDKTIKDLNLANKPEKVRVMDATPFKTQAKLKEAVLDYAEEIAGKPLNKVDMPDGSDLWNVKVERPDGTQVVVNVREKSTTKNKNDADVGLTLEIIDKDHWQANGWPKAQLELKFGWGTKQ